MAESSMKMTRHSSPATPNIGAFRPVATLAPGQMTRVPTEFNGIGHGVRIVRMAVVFVSLVLFQLNVSLAQPQTVLSTANDDVARLRNILNSSTRLVVDTTAEGLRRRTDALTDSASRSAERARSSLAWLTDSLIRSAQDSLDDSRKDTLQTLFRLLLDEVTRHETAAHSSLNQELSRMKQDLESARASYTVCANCGNRQDFEERLSDFREFADSVASAFFDTTASIADGHRDLMADAFDASADSLRDVRDNLIDNRLGDIDVWRYGLTRLVISSSYSSHNSYRGRDNGLLQHSIAPSVTFRHSSGVSIQASGSRLEGSAHRWDNFLLSGEYDFRLSGVTGGSFSYTHFWFSDSSTSVRSVFTDNAEAGLSFDWPAISIAALGSLNFGKATEFTAAATISHDFEIPFTLYDRALISPAVTWTIGQQNSNLTTLLTTKAKGKKATATTTTQTKAITTFGVLDYEFCVPVSIEVGPVTVVPSATYIVPLNVLGVSSKGSFVNLDIGLSITIR